MKSVSVSATVTNSASSAATTAAWQAVAASERGALEEVARRAEEEEWIARARTGDIEAFGLVYDRYEASVFRHAYRMMENVEEADDIRQETFIRACQSLAKFRGDCRIRTYLFSICGNICRDRLRQKKRHAEHGYGLTTPEGATNLVLNSSHDFDDPFHSMERAADAARVQTALRRLAPDDREILLLRYVEGMNMDDIAAAIGCTRISAPVRAFRARQRFKNIFLSLLKEEGE
jgi:RNA polymerase sigma-70 factor (ECF subfamily)